MGPETGFTGQAKAEPGGLQPKQRFGAAGAYRIFEAWNLPTEGAELVGVLITKLKTSP
jgi:hypothetical protein